jgi:hypothetical protein
MVVTFRNYVIAELNRMLTLDTGDSRPSIGQQTSFSGTVPFGKKSASTFLIIKVKICMVIELISCV